MAVIERQRTEAAELADQVLAELEETGWCKGIGDPYGKGCLVITLNRVVMQRWEGVQQLERDQLRTRMLREIRKRVGPQIVAWNDHPDRTYADVVALLTDIRDNG